MGTWIAWAFSRMEKKYKDHQSQITDLKRELEEMKQKE
jgi:hypothetical protein